MAFPQVLGVSQGDLATSTSHSIAYASPGAGDLGVLIIQEDDDDALTISDFTFIGSATTTSGLLAVYARKMTGSEGTGTFTVAIAATEEICYHLYYIDAGTWRDSGTLTADVNVATQTFVNTIADPPSLNPGSWGTEDTLWISCVGSVGSVTWSSASGNYTNRLENYESTACGLSTCRRELNAASEDPSGQGQSASGGNHYAVTIGIRPSGDATYSLVKMAATASMPVLTSSGPQSFDLAKMAATASMPVVVASLEWLLVKMAATASMPSGNVSLGAALVKMAATASMLNATVALEGALAKMAATARMPDIIDVLTPYDLTKMAATAQMPQGVAAIDVTLLKMSATASMPTATYTEALLYFLVAMNAAASMPSTTLAADHVQTLVVMAASARMPSLASAQLEALLAKMAASASMPSLVIAFAEPLAVMQATARMPALSAEDQRFLVKMSATALMGNADVPALEVALAVMMATARILTAMRGGVLPGDPRYRLPAGTAGWPEAPPAGSAAALPRLPMGAASE